MREKGHSNYLSGASVTKRKGDSEILDIMKNDKMISRKTVRFYHTVCKTLLSDYCKLIDPF